MTAVTFAGVPFPMRQILLSLVILSAFAFAQNVLAVSPAAADSNGFLATPLAPPGAERDALPPTGSMALLLAGLGGLSIAGRRFEGRASS